MKPFLPSQHHHLQHYSPHCWKNIVSTLSLLGIHSLNVLLAHYIAVNTSYGSSLGTADPGIQALIALDWLFGESLILTAAIIKLWGRAKNTGAELSFHLLSRSVKLRLIQRTDNLDTWRALSEPSEIECVIIHDQAFPECLLHPITLAFVLFCCPLCPFGRFDASNPFI
jgi:hypothetical protein